MGDCFVLAILDYMEDSFKPIENIVEKEESTPLHKNQLQTPKGNCLPQPPPMTPNTRKKKSCIASEITILVRNLDSPTPAEKAIAFSIGLKQLGLYDRVHFEKKVHKIRKKIDIIWN